MQPFLEAGIPCDSCLHGPGKVACCPSSSLSARLLRPGCLQLWPASPPGCPNLKALWTQAARGCWWCLEVTRGRDFDQMWHAAEGEELTLPLSRLLPSLRFPCSLCSSCQMQGAAVSPSWWLCHGPRQGWSSAGWMEALGCSLTHLPSLAAEGLPVMSTTRGSLSPPFQPPTPNPPVFLQGGRVRRTQVHQLFLEGAGWLVSCFCKA